MNQKDGVAEMGLRAFARCTIARMVLTDRCLPTSHSSGFPSRKGPVFQVTWSTRLSRASVA